MDIDKEFKYAVNYINSSEKINTKKKITVNNELKLYFYSYFKQATIGDCNINRPTGIFDITAKLKYDAWKKLEGVSQNEAKKKYIEKFNEKYSEYLNL